MIALLASSFLRFRLKRKALPELVKKWKKCKSNRKTDKLMNGPKQVSKHTSKNNSIRANSYLTRYIAHLCCLLWWLCKEYWPKIVKPTIVSIVKKIVCYKAAMFCASRLSGCFVIIFFLFWSNFEKNVIFGTLGPHSSRTKGFERRYFTWVSLPPICRTTKKLKFFNFIRQ